MNTKLGFGMIATMLLVTPAAADVERTRTVTKGGAVSASWQSSDDCQTTTVGLWAFEQAARATAGQPEYSQQIHVEVWHYDWCTGESWDATASATSGLTINRLDDATVEVPVNIATTTCGWTEDGSWACTEDVTDTGTLSVAFAGTGDTTTGRWVSSYSQGDTTLHERNVGKYRQATATGSLVLRGIELLAGDAFADLQQLSWGSHSITRY